MAIAMTISQGSKARHSPSRATNKGQLSAKVLSAITEQRRRERTLAPDSIDLQLVNEELELMDGEDHEEGRVSS
jgi:hypothetical protein